MTITLFYLSKQTSGSRIIVVVIQAEKTEVSNMAAHPIDYEVIGGNFSTDEARQIWSEEAKLEKQFIVEQALAKVEGAQGCNSRKRS
jgi:hypothetical protein